MINFSKMRDIREDHDMTQKDMASILGVNRSTYSLWELGINIIPIKHLCDFADYFNYTIDYVLGLTNSKTKVNIIKGFNLIATILLYHVVFDLSIGFEKNFE